MLKSNPIVEIKPWKGHGGVFFWLTFVNNFENKLTLIEREYLSEKKAEEIKKWEAYSIEETMDKHALKEIETLAKRELIELVTTLRQEVARNKLLPYLWKNIPFNRSLQEAYVSMYKKSVPFKYESLIGDENTPILDQSEIQEAISDRAVEILSEDSHSKYQLWQRIKTNDDSLPKGSELLQVLDKFIQNEKNYYFSIRCSSGSYKRF
jgi:hypothetical protein